MDGSFSFDMFIFNQLSFLTNNTHPNISITRRSNVTRCTGTDFFHLYVRFVFALKVVFSLVISPLFPNGLLVCSLYFAFFSILSLPFTIRFVRRSPLKMAIVANGKVTLLLSHLALLNLHQGFLILRLWKRLFKQICYLILSVIL